MRKLNDNTSSEQMVSTTKIDDLKEDISNVGKIANKNKEDIIEINQTLPTIKDTVSGLATEVDTKTVNANVTNTTSLNANSIKAPTVSITNTATIEKANIADASIKKELVVESGISDLTAKTAHITDLTVSGTANITGATYNNLTLNGETDIKDLKFGTLKGSNVMIWPNGFKSLADRYNRLEMYDSSQSLVMFNKSVNGGYGSTSISTLPNGIYLNTDNENGQGWGFAANGDGIQDATFIKETAKKKREWYDYKTTKSKLNEIIGATDISNLLSTGNTLYYSGTYYEVDLNENSRCRLLAEDSSKNKASFVIERVGNNYTISYNQPYKMISKIYHLKNGNLVFEVTNKWSTCKYTFDSLDLERSITSTDTTTIKNWTITQNEESIKGLGNTFTPSTDDKTYTLNRDFDTLFTGHISAPNVKDGGGLIQLDELKLKSTDKLTNTDITYDGTSTVNAQVYTPDQEVNTDSDVTFNTARITKDMEVGGKLTVKGDFIKTDTLEVKDNDVILRADSTTGLPVGSTSGIRVENFNGNNKDVKIAADNTGTLRIGTAKTGAEPTNYEPFLTRSEEADLVDGSLLKWDATNKKAVKSTLIDKTTETDETLTSILAVDSNGNVKQKTVPSTVTNNGGIEFKSLQQINDVCKPETALVVGTSSVLGSTTVEVFNAIKAYCNANKVNGHAFLSGLEIGDLDYTKWANSSGVYESQLSVEIEYTYANGRGYAHTIPKLKNQATHTMYMLSSNTSLDGVWQKDTDKILTEKYTGNAYIQVGKDTDATGERSVIKTKFGDTTEWSLISLYRPDTTYSQNNLYVSAGKNTVIGSGSLGSSAWNSKKATKDSSSLFLTGQDGIELSTGNSDYSKATKSTLDKSGNLTIANNITANGKVISTGDATANGATLVQNMYSKCTTSVYDSTKPYSLLAYKEIPVISWDNEDTKFHFHLMTSQYWLDCDLRLFFRWSPETTATENILTKYCNIFNLTSNKNFPNIENAFICKYTFTPKTVSSNGSLKIWLYFDDSVYNASGWTNYFAKELYGKEEHYLFNVNASLHSDARTWTYYRSSTNVATMEGDNTITTTWVNLDKVNVLNANTIGVNNLTTNNSTILSFGNGNKLQANSDGSVGFTTTTGTYNLIDKDGNPVYNKYTSFTTSSDYVEYKLFTVPADFKDDFSFYINDIYKANYNGKYNTLTVDCITTKNDGSAMDVSYFEDNYFNLGKLENDDGTVSVYFIPSTNFKNNTNVVCTPNSDIKNNIVFYYNDVEKNNKRTSSIGLGSFPSIQTPGILYGNRLWVVPYNKFIQYETSRYHNVCEIGNIQCYIHKINSSTLTYTPGWVNVTYSGDGSSDLFKGLVRIDIFGRTENRPSGYCLGSFKAKDITDYTVETKIVPTFKYYYDDTDSGTWENCYVICWCLRS